MNKIMGIFAGLALVAFLAPSQAVAEHCKTSFGSLEGCSEGTSEQLTANGCTPKPGSCPAKRAVWHCSLPTGIKHYMYTPYNEGGTTLEYPKKNCEKQGGTFKSN